MGWKFSNVEAVGDLIRMWRAELNISLRGSFTFSLVVFLILHSRSVNKLVL